MGFYKIILTIFLFISVQQIKGTNLLDSLKKENDHFKRAEILLAITETCEIDDIKLYANQLLKICDSLMQVAPEKKSLLNSHRAYAYNNLGFMYKNQGVADKALKNFYLSLSLSTKIKDSIGIADTYTNLGSTYQQQQDVESADKFFNKALNIYKNIEDEGGMAIIYNNLGLLYEKYSKKETAIKYYQLSYEYWKKLDMPRYKAYSLNNIGVNLDDLGQPNSALIYHLKALEIFKTLDDNEDLAWTYNLIGRHYIDQNNYYLSKEYLNKAYQLAQTNTSVETKRNIIENFYHLNNAIKKYDLALKYYKNFIQLNDSIKNESTQKAAIQQQAKYEYEKQKAIDDAEHEKQLAIEQEAKEKQQILTVATGAGLGLVGIFLIFVFNRLKVTRKQKGIIELAHSQLEEKNTEILDSISYAKRIQNAILPPGKVVKQYLQESFIFYKPKDIVAGDFYWLETISDEGRMMSNENSTPNTQHSTTILFATADCTGHGVPGAMVSVVCNNGLNRAVREHGLTDPGKILDKTREIVVAEFEKSEEEVKDGMDIALCSLSVDSNQSTVLKYAGAHNPLWIIRKDTDLIEEIKANKQPIGKFDHPEPYTTHTLKLLKGDTIYIFSDGYADQFGGEKGKKLKTANFKKLLLSIQQENMQKQRELVDEAFENWKGKLEQLDDVCVIGVRV